MSAQTSLLEGRRFATRFLGRPGTWIWLAATLVPGVASWVWADRALRGFAGDERTWFLWSGNVVLGLFVLTLAFVFRKWAVKIPGFRNFGRAPAAMADACWAEVQVLNRRIRKGDFPSDAEVRKAADEILRRFHVEKIERAEIETLQIAGRTVKFVRLRKREPFGRLEPWLEMHMGIGAAGCVGVWFHADGVLRHPIGWVLFVGSMLLLVTGIAMAVLYRTLPAKLAKVGGEIPFEEAGVARENYEASLAGVVATLPPELQNEVRALLDASPTVEELRRRGEAVLTRAALSHPDQVETVRDVMVMAGTRDYLLWTTAEARRIDFQLRVWRWIHVPLSVFVFFAIAVHVLAVLWY